MTLIVSLLMGCSVEAQFVHSMEPYLLYNISLFAHGNKTLKDLNKQDIFDTLWPFVC